MFGGSIRFNTAALRSGEYPKSSSYPARLTIRGKVEQRTTSQITARRIRRGSYSSVDDLKAAIHDYLAQHNEKPKTFKWTKTAEDILTRERRALDTLDEIRGNR